MVLVGRGVLRPSSVCLGKKGRDGGRRGEKLRHALSLAPSFALGKHNLPPTTSAHCQEGDQVVGRQVVPEGKKTCVEARRGTEDSPSCPYSKVKLNFLRNLRGKGTSPLSVLFLLALAFLRLSKDQPRRKMELREIW